MGRRVWVVVDNRELTNIPFVVDLLVTRLGRFLPAGPVAAGEPSSHDGIRSQALAELWTDNGYHVVAVADIRLEKPSTAGSQDS